MTDGEDGEDGAPELDRGDVQPWPNAAARAAARAGRRRRARRSALVGGDGRGAGWGELAGPAATPAYPPPFASVEAPIVPLPARPRVEPDHDSLFGLTRRSHSRLGSRLFTGFFVFVFALIVVHLVVVLLNG